MYRYVGNSWATVFGVLGADRYNLSEQENGEAMGIQAVVVIICTILYIYVSGNINHHYHKLLICIYSSSSFCCW